MKKLIFGLLALLPILVLGQTEEHISWTHSMECGENPGQVKLISKAEIEKGWHLYDVVPMEGIFAPNPTVVSIKQLEGDARCKYVLAGPTSSPTKAHEEYDSALETDARFYEDEAIIEQVFTLREDVSELVCFLEYQMCDDQQCIFPWPLEVKVPVPDGCFDADVAAKTECEVVDEKNVENGTTGDMTYEVNDPGEETTEASEKTSAGGDCGEFVYKEDESTKGMWLGKVDENKSLWALFFACFGFGILALLTPCVFPMIPMTVNFFIKQSKNKRSGIANALLYGVSIIVIYTGLGFILTLAFGGDVMNEMASNGWVNIIFFAVFLVFGFSFLGAFEITLPSWIVNKSDAQADKGGLIGIFFMAFTLAVVSFSCTGPIIGNLLVAAANEDAVAGPIIGMFGFSLALSIPFMLFAIFPSWLANMPQSGGWLNAVKVVLGLAELALALKFLSNVDLAYHWGILSREIFLSSWIIITALIGFYLIGKLKFSHDSDLPFISVPRIFMAIVFFSFSVYMVPGLWGAPVKLLSGLAPPGTHVEDANWMRRGTAREGEINAKELDPDAECPNGIPCTKDYETAMEYACKYNKPVFVDFTGYTCVNCRKMEDGVWPDPKIDKFLRDEFVVVSLYVDDKKPLPADKIQTIEVNGREIKMTEYGHIWKNMQAHRAGTSSQPYYILIGPDEKLLNNPKAYTPDVDEYAKWLQEGLDAFEESY